MIEKQTINWILVELLGEQRILSFSGISSKLMNRFLWGFFKDFIYLFLERGGGREEERERNISVWLLLVCTEPGTWPTAPALTGNRTGDPLVRKPVVVNPLSLASQSSKLTNRFYFIRNID